MAQQPTLEWAQRYNGRDNGWDEAVAVAVDEQGNSYVTGNSSYETPENITRYRITTVKYSPSGKQLWTMRFKDVSSASAIAVDNQGSVYVTGDAGAWNSGYSFLTIRYDAATGQQIWEQRYAEGTATAIAVDNQGGVYVTGSGSDDYLTIRYEAVTGRQTWASRYNGPGEEYYNSDLARAIAVDNLGGVYVTGYSRSPDLIDDSYWEYATVRYDAATGRQTWVQSYFTAVYDSYEYFIDIAVDNSGGVYVTGYKEDDTFNDADSYVTIRYDAATGQETWTQFYNSNESDDRATAIAVDNQGGVYVTGTSVTIRYAATTGEETWVSSNDNNSGNIVIVAAQGSVYVTGTIYGDRRMGDNYLTVRYDAPPAPPSATSTYLILRQVL